MFHSYSRLHVTEHSVINDSRDACQNPRHTFNILVTKESNSNNNTTVKHVATVLPFEFLFCNLPRTSSQKLEYVSSSSLTAANYELLSQNAAKNPTGRHSAIKVYSCVQ